MNETGTATTEATFTQEDVNRIVQERLSRERAKADKLTEKSLTEREKLLDEREAALQRREAKAACEDYLKEKGIPNRHWQTFLGNLDTSNVGGFQKAVDALGKPYIESTTVEGADVPHPPATTYGEDMDAKLRKAFARKT